MWNNSVRGAVKVLLICNIVIFLFQTLLDAASGGLFTYLFGLSAEGISRGFYWQFVTYQFLHGNLMHILFNMMALYFLGPVTLQTVGNRHFLIIYLMSGVLGGLGWIQMHPYSGYFCVGASGSVVGVVAAFTILFPNRPMMLLIFPFRPFKAWVLAVGILVIEFLLMLARPGGGIAHSVHLMGGMVGAVYTLIVFRRDWLIHRMSGRHRMRRPPTISRDEVDRILDKISRQGIGSLTPRERAVLKDASERRQI